MKKVTKALALIGSILASGATIAILNINKPEQIESPIYESYLEDASDLLSESPMEVEAKVSKLNTTLLETDDNILETKNMASLLSSSMRVQKGIDSKGNKCMRFVIAVPSLDVSVDFVREIEREDGTKTKKSFTATKAYTGIYVSDEIIRPSEFNSDCDGADYKYFFCYTLSAITEESAIISVNAWVTDMTPSTLDYTNKGTFTTYNAASLAGLSEITGTVAEYDDLSNFYYDGTFVYSEDDGELDILWVDPKNTNTKVIIPETVEIKKNNVMRSLPIRKVNDTAFTNAGGIEEVIFENSSLTIAPFALMMNSNIVFSANYSMEDFYSMGNYIAPGKNGVKIYCSDGVVHYFTDKVMLETKSEDTITSQVYQLDISTQSYSYRYNSKTTLADGKVSNKYSYDKENDLISTFTYFYSNDKLVSITEYENGNQVENLVYEDDGSLYLYFPDYFYSFTDTYDASGIATYYMMNDPIYNRSITFTANYNSDHMATEFQYSILGNGLIMCYEMNEYDQFIWHSYAGVIDGQKAYDYKTEYIYDSKGNILNVSNYSYNEELDCYEAILVVTYSYNFDGSFMLTEEAGSSKKENYYNECHFLTKRYSYSYNEETLTWDLIEKTINTSNRKIEDAIQINYVKDSSGSFVEAVKVEHILVSQKDTYIHYNFIDGTWAPSYKYDYLYDNPELNYTYIEYKYDDGNWVILQKIEFGDTETLYHYDIELGDYVLGHVASDSVSENMIEATCETEGSYDQVSYCKYCDYEMDREKQVIPMLEHNYEGGYCSGCGKKEYTDLVDIASGGTYTVKGTVIAISANGFLLKDSTDYVLVYYSTSIPSDISIGDILKVYGTVVTHKKALQFTGTSATVTKLGTTSVVHPTATPTTAEEITELANASTPAKIYRSVTGTFTISGNYYNVSLGITNIQVSLLTPHSTYDLSSYSGSEITFKGYYLYTTGTSKKYVYFISTELVTCSHNYEQTDHLDATCSSMGYTEYECSLCGDSYKDVIYKLAHDYVDGVCSVCGTIETETPLFVKERFGMDAIIYRTGDSNPYGIDLSTYGSDVMAVFYTPNITSVTIDPYESIDTEEEITSFYNTYTIASSYEDAYYRSLHHLMSGDITLQHEYPTSLNIKKNGLDVRATTAFYVLSTTGEYLAYLPNTLGDDYAIYYGGAYTSMNEVAAYLLAFGEVPANSKYVKGTTGQSSAISDWGIYGRVNLDDFSGPQATNYQYEPALATSKAWKETDFGNGYAWVFAAKNNQNCAVYNTGSMINRGVCRFIYVADSSVKNIDERYVWYTYNHYNDFQDYLNYDNGFGAMFGNLTGGGTLNSYSADTPPVQYTEPYRTTWANVKSYI